MAVPLAGAKHGRTEPVAAGDHCQWDMKTHPHSLFARPLRLVLGLGLALLGGTLVAQTTVRRDPPPAALKHADRNFIEKAARSGMDEIDISQVAAQRTSNPDVRRLAQMMVADHGAANEELAALAAAKGVSLPAKDADHASKWVKRDAKNFDHDYLDKMVSDHEDAVKLFEKEAKDGEDAESVAFARKHLPKLQHHLQQALDLKRLLK